VAVAAAQRPMTQCRSAGLVLLYVLALFAAPLPAGAATVDDLAWLKGCWTSDHKERQTTEYWLKPAGLTMLGVSRTIVGGKTVEFEFMQIRQEENGEIYFIANPSGQKETRFKLVKASAREVVFENPAHDFPQRVIYRCESEGVLLGRIEGTSKGKEKAVDFPMKRISCDE
jgi:hypothetical protein